MEGALIALCVCGQAAAGASSSPDEALTAGEGGAAPERPTETRRLDVGALPIADFSTDVGLGLGLYATLFVRDAGHQPYQYGVRVQAYFTTGGVQNHFLRLDAPRFLGSPLRPTLTLGFFRDLLRPWYGVGNERPLPPPEDPAWTSGYFIHDLVSPRASLTVRWALGGPWHLEGGYAYQHLVVSSAPASLLQAAKPSGWNGGRVGQLEAAVVYDARDAEASPTLGALGKLGVRAAHPALGASSSFAGGYLLAAGYYSHPALGPYLVGAGRVTIDAVTGDVPVDVLTTLGGGPEAFEGLGGVSSLRGLPRYRFVGKLKALGNLELRSRVLRVPIFGGRPLDVWLAAFADAGRVWADWAPDGPFWRLHVAAGGGLRLAWVEDFVLRVDAGFSEGNLGFYVEFGQLF